MDIIYMNTIIEQLYNKQSWYIIVKYIHMVC